MKNFIKSIKIGKKGLKNNLFLAPMLGYTNFAFRGLVQKTALISTFTEMISINALSKDSNYCKDQIKRGEDEKNVFYQFFGNDEEKTVESIQNILNLNIKIDFFNLNCGCPAADIIKQGAGCALLKRESKINAIIKRVKENYDFPVTIKIRSGYDTTKHLDYIKLEESGLDALFIHAKTKKQQYSGKIDLNYIKEAKERTNIPIITNGDIKNRDDLSNIHNTTNCDGFMIGREALYNPFVFEELIYNKKRNFHEKIDFLEKYYVVLKENNIGSAYINIKLLSLFMAKNMTGVVELRRKISVLKNAGEIIATLKKVE